MTTAHSPITERKPRRAPIAGQGAWLFSGFGAAQVCAFLRNAILGHALSMGDFGVAATLTLLLQIVETLSDLGSDRLIVQATDGGQRRFMAACHLVLAARGFLIGAALLVIGPVFARFFAVPQATEAFQLMAFAPMIKGLTHLDFRRAQRRFDNRPFVALEVLPQVAALALTPAALALSPDYTTVAWLSIIQALMAVGLSHMMARRPYKIAFDLTYIKRHISFGWPILASALPLVAVYHGDRMIIGHTQGMEALAGFSAAFMIAMAPGLIASKVGHALMLPLFSSARRRNQNLAAPFLSMTEIVVTLAAVYLALFIVVGGEALRLAFGPNYQGLGTVVSLLSAMWALRMIQAVPGMALMAAGETKPMLVAGIIRAHALPCVLLAATLGASLATLAAIGCVFEALSLAYIAVRVERLELGSGARLAAKAAFLAPIGVFAALVKNMTVTEPQNLAIASALTLSVTLATALAVMPSLRTRAHRALQPRPGLAQRPLAPAALEN
ncbi:MAG: oligosaccharide flippase family protein [Hyphomicrobium sp.]